ncbi:MAG TPA: aminotransferase class IV [Terriglobia bacterium]|nr:aminotransferase class IV [Terriglobia bacterium]
MDQLILHNDSIVPLADTRLSPGQSGLLSGLGVFTTLRVYRGQPFQFHHHWQRMSRDAGRLGVNLSDFTEATVRDAIVRLASANQRVEGMGRVWFVRNDGGLWSDGIKRRPTDLLVFTRELVPWPESHRLLLQENAVFSAGVLSGAKMLSWAQNALLLERARAQGFDDALLLNERGELAECTSANIFVVGGGAVLTPPLSSGCLPGVTREVLFEIACAAGVELREGNLTPDDLSVADEVFISSTTREVAAVSFVSPQWTYAAPGAITQKLETAFRRYVNEALERP